MTDQALSPPVDAVEVSYEELCGALAAKNLSPLWKVNRELMPLEHRSSTLPWLWRWRSLLPMARRCGELITIDRGGDRRVLALANPGLQGRPYTSTTLWGAIQYLGPHESAPAHRHTPNAIRFVIEGEGVWTTVNGDACDMLPGDLILTPSWHWHDHNNSGDRPMLWFDGLDLPLVGVLEAVFFELYPDETQPVVSRNLSELLYGKGIAPHEPRPGSVRDGSAGTARAPAGGLASPLLRYPYTTTDAQLEAMLAGTRSDVATVHFVNPANGRSALPTLGLSMVRLLAGAATAPVRRAGSSIVVVFRGSGYTVMNGTRFDWGEKDIFVVPSWVAAEHHALERSDLFVTSDRPVLEALGLYREEMLDEEQSVSARFVPL